MPALREDIAVALVKLKGYDTAGYDESVLTTMFSDAYSISAAARPYAATAVQRGLVSGYEDDTLRGQQGAVSFFTLIILRSRKNAVDSFGMM